MPEITAKHYELMEYRLWNYYPLGNAKSKAKKQYKKEKVENAKKEKAV